MCPSSLFVLMLTAEGWLDMLPLSPGLEDTLGSRRVSLELP